MGINLTLQVGFLRLS